MQQCKKISAPIYDLMILVGEKERGRETGREKRKRKNERDKEREKERE